MAKGLIERDNRKLAPMVDEASARQAARSGMDGALRTDTAAGAAAARAAERRR